MAKVNVNQNVNRDSLFSKETLRYLFLYELLYSMTNCLEQQQEFSPNLQNLFEVLTDPPTASHEKQFYI